MNSAYKHFPLVIILLGLTIPLIVYCTINFNIYFLLLTLSLLLFSIYPELGLVLLVSGSWVVEIIFVLLKVPEGFRGASLGMFLGLSLIFYTLIIKKRIPSFFEHKIYQVSYIFTALLFLGVLYTPNKQYGIFKALGFLIFCLFPMIVMIFFQNDLGRLKRIINLFIILSIPGLIYGLNQLYYKRIEGYRFSLGEINPIWYGRILGVIIISLLYIYATHTSKIRYFFIVFIFPAMLLMLYTGSRGPLLSLTFSLILFLFLCNNIRLSRRLLLFIFLGTFFIILVYNFIPQHLKHKFMSYDDENVAIRLIYFPSSIIHFSKNLLVGVGTGGYEAEAFLIERSSFRKYPHNIILEIIAEMGLFGLSLFVYFIFLVYKISKNLFHLTYKNPKYRPIFAWSFCIFTFSLLNSFVSGDLVTNVLVWFSSGYLCILSSTIKKSILQNRK